MGSWKTLKPYKGLNNSWMSYRRLQLSPTILNKFVSIWCKCFITFDQNGIISCFTFRLLKTARVKAVTCCSWSMRQCHRHCKHQVIILIKNNKK